MFRQTIKKIPGARRAALALGLIAIPKRERRFLLDYFQEGSEGAEVGVHLGDFSREILNNVKPATLHLIDPWEHQAEFKDAWYGGKVHDGQAEMDHRYAKVQSRFTNEIANGQVKLHRGYSADSLESFPDESLDWVYIDANHLYEYVAEDLKISFRKVKHGGYITGDDYKEGGWWQGGVKRAVDEFARQKTGRLLEIRNSQFVFQKT